jgi:hypothetical protein
MAFSIQTYPRLDTKDCNNCLDDSKLQGHVHKLTLEELKQLIEQAIKAANIKSGRKLLNIPDNADELELAKHYLKAAKALFRYFRTYPVDPAATAYQILNRSYQHVGVDLFRASTQQKARMNSGWRYQYLVVGLARESKRFISVSDIGTAEGDFNAVIALQDNQKPPLSLYVSVKNRRNTLGGQDWPKAITALETVAQKDKNRQGPYCCIFGIAMDRGQRYIKIEDKTQKPHSNNTEIWLSDYFWPFFSNYSYEEIMTCMLDVLMESHDADELATELSIPFQVIEKFGELCLQKNLINTEGLFDNPHQLVKFFVGSL